MNPPLLPIDIFQQNHAVSAQGKTPASQTVSGIVTISPMSYEVESQLSSSGVAAPPPLMSARDELEIWMSSTAVKAPSIVPSTAIH